MDTQTDHDLSENSSEKRAGFVGLGLMGGHMAANLLESGWTVTGWNRSAAALAEFEASGGKRASGVAALRDEPVIVFMLPDLSYIEEAAAGLFACWSQNPPRPGTAVVVMSSVSPAAVRDFGARVSAASGGNAIVVDFTEAVAFSTYRLERKFALAEATWQSINGVGDFTATSTGPAQFIHNSATEPKALYRVRLLP